MGLRDRLKQVLRRTLGPVAPSSVAAPPAPAPPARPTPGDMPPRERAQPGAAPPTPATSAPQAPSTPATASSPAVAPPPATEAPRAAAPPTPVAQGENDTPDTSEKDAANQQDKIERARTRARKGVLKHIQSRGGALPMADAHDHSERRYFIAHRGFSDMMEWWLTEGYIRYEEGVVTVTEEGAAYATAP